VSFVVKLEVGYNILMTAQNPLLTWETLTTSPEETLSLAEQLGRLLQTGDIVALMGELGSGKTLFCQGLAAGLEVPHNFHITSPTFAIINEYPGRIPFYHMDLYRVDSVAEFPDLGLEEVLCQEGAVAIEWAERLDYLLPAARLEVRLNFEDETSRSFIFRAFGTKAQERLTALVGSCDRARERS
jgi:tRNA threonylcarbamoyladenosine biosynthesis protein TsaE